MGHTAAVAQGFLPPDKALWNFSHDDDKGDDKDVYDCDDDDDDDDDDDVDDDIEWR